MDTGHGYGTAFWHFDDFLRTYRAWELIEDFCLGHKLYWRWRNLISVAAALPAYCWDLLTLSLLFRQVWAKSRSCGSSSTYSSGILSLFARCRFIRAMNLKGIQILRVRFILSNPVSLLMLFWFVASKGFIWNLDGRKTTTTREVAATPLPLPQPRGVAHANRVTETSRFQYCSYICNLRRMPNPSNYINQVIPEKQDHWNIILN